MKTWIILTGLLSILVLPVSATPASSQLNSLYAVGQIDSEARIIPVLRKNESRLVKALKARHPLYSFMEGWHGRKDSDIDPGRFSFFYESATIDKIRPEDTGSKVESCRYFFGKYCFPTGELYYKVRVPFAPTPELAARAKDGMLIDGKPAPVLWLFVSKSGSVLSFW